MARPRISTEPRVVTGVRLPRSVHQRLRHAAAERDVSVNRLVTRAVEEYLDRLPAVEESLGAGAPRPAGTSLHPEVAPR